MQATETKSLLSQQVSRCDSCNTAAFPAIFPCHGSQVRQVSLQSKTEPLFLFFRSFSQVSCTYLGRSICLIKLKVKKKIKKEKSQLQRNSIFDDLVRWSHLTELTSDINLFILQTKKLYLFYNLNYFSNRLCITIR